MKIFIAISDEFRLIFISDQCDSTSHKSSCRNNMSIKVLLKKLLELDNYMSNDEVLLVDHTNC